MILRTSRLVLTPALKFPILGHGVEMAMSRQFGGLYRPWSKERPEIITHGASKTKAREHLTIRFGIEPDFVDKIVFHWNVLLRQLSSDKIAACLLPTLVILNSMSASPSRNPIISSTTYEYV